MRFHHFTCIHSLAAIFRINSSTRVCCIVCYSIHLGSEAPHRHDTTKEGRCWLLSIEAKTALGVGRLGRQAAMAQFKQWALEYVLSDDEPAQLEITKKAAKGEERTLSVSGTLLLISCL